MDKWYIEDVTDENCNKYVECSGNHSGGNEVKTNDLGMSLAVKKYRSSDSSIKDILQLKNNPTFCGGGSAIATVGNKTYVFGGCSISGIQSQVFSCYDHDSKEWVDLSELDKSAYTQRHSHTAVAHKKIVYIFGGQSDNLQNNKSPLPACVNDLFCYDTEDKSWSIIQQTEESEIIPSRRDSHTAAILQRSDNCEGKMIIFGGANAEEGPNNECWLFDIKTEKWKQLMYGNTIHDPVPEAREMHAACIVSMDTISSDNEDENNISGFEMIVMGGRNQKGSVCQDCWSLKLETMRWEKLPDPPFPICSHSVATFVPNNSGNVTLCFFGGWDGGDTVFDSFLLYDVKIQKWTTVKRDDVSLRHRFAHACSVSEDNKYMFLLGGVTDSPVEDLSELVQVSMGSLCTNGYREKC